MSELPNGWARIALRELGSWGSGGTPKRTEPLFFSNGTIPWLVIGDLNNGVVTNAQTYITEEGLLNSSAKLLPPNTLLVAMYGSIGKLGITGIECATNQAIAFCIPEQAIIELRYLFHALKYSKDRLIAQGQGVAQKNINQNILKAHQIPVAPRREQNLIANELDSLFMRVDACCDRLDRVPGILKRFRQAALATAVFGGLTEDWRKNNSNIESGSDLFIRLQEQFRGDFIHGILSSQEENHTRGLLPESWSYAPVKAVGEVFLGRQRSPKNHSGLHMHPYVRAANITWNGWNFSDVKEMNFDPHDFERYELRLGDVLVNEGSGSADEVGKPAIWKGEIENCCFQNTLICVRPFEEMSEYLYLVFLHAALSKAFVKETRGIGIRHLGKERFAAFLIPLPPLKEQQEIVRRVKTFFAYADRLEAHYKTARARVDLLMPALLSKAFQGKLVSQDPNDEPAPVLLGRIRQSQLENPGRKTSKRTMSKSPRISSSLHERIYNQFKVNVFDAARLLDLDGWAAEENREDLFQLLDQGVLTMERKEGSDGYTLQCVRKPREGGE